jgi:methylated-DNA-[protein]-cysteine S-methyltransferase
MEPSISYTPVIYYTWMTSPTGKLLLAADEAGGLRHIIFENGREVAKPLPHWRESAAPLHETMRQLRAWFTGELRDFNLVLAPQGPAFHQQVWRELCNIPYGETISYGEIAQRIGSPQAFRAVGRANGANPIPIVIPCHRVIGSNGKLTGYGGGLPRKEFLLALEHKQLSLPLAASAAAPSRCS